MFIYRFSRLWTEMIKLCEALALLLFAALAPDSNAAAQPAGPTMAVSASQQMKERHVHSCTKLVQDSGQPMEDPVVEKSGRPQ